MLLAPQVAILIFWVVALAFYPYPGHLRPINNWLACASRGRTVVVLGLLPVIVCAIVTWRAGVPVPRVHDEFSYLLASDTFAHGRLTNPTHPLWKHFETYHVIFQPTYQSKYFPAQGLFLALGQVLTNRPIVGVWISLGLALAALTWMLQAWVSARWALLAGVLAAAKLSILMDWGLSYWGGAVAMLGGSLFLGGLARWIRRPGVFTGIAAASGLALLANSRPYEGLIFVVLSSLLLVLPQAVRRPWRLLLASWKKSLPALALLSANFLWIGYYNYRVTLNPLTFPYQVWSQQYLGMAAARAALAGTASGSATVSRILLPSGADGHLPQTEGLDDPADILNKLAKFRQFYAGAFIGAAALAALTRLKSRKIWGAVLVLAILTFAVVMENTTGNAHYIAPATCVLMLLVAKGFQRIWTARSLKSLRIQLPLAVLGATISTLFLFLFLWRLDETWPVERARVTNMLQQSGRHAVIVKYEPTHSFFEEWVYNGADIDAAQIVWARDLGPQKNQELIRYYPDRTIWELDADARPASLKEIREPVMRSSGSAAK